MKIYAMSDLHLDLNYNKPMSVFGEKWDAHINKIERHWKQCITNEDYVLIPGDISWALRLNEAHQDLEWLNALPGYKICCRGNHDYWWSKPKKLNTDYSHITFLQNDAYLIGAIGICGVRGWIMPDTEGATLDDERLYMRELDRLKLSLENALKQGAKELWVLIHYPPISDQTIASPFEVLIDHYPVSKVIYGHLHDEASWQRAIIGRRGDTTYYLVSADYLAFRPLEI